MAKLTQKETEIVKAKVMADCAVRHANVLMQNACFTKEYPLALQQAAEDKDKGRWAQRWGKTEKFFKEQGGLLGLLDKIGTTANKLRGWKDDEASDVDFGWGGTKERKIQPWVIGLVVVLLLVGIFFFIRYMRKNKGKK